ncbi:unnamed protein product [Ectocarpus sp. 12 AP-2014]
MAKTLEEMTSRYTADQGAQRKERALDPGRMAYNVAVRSGLCNAYLAASVVCSGLVSTSKVGVIGKAGTALKLISGSVPLVGGLASFAGAALRAGDSVIQTRRLEKIADLAPDAVEFSHLAKSLALRLADGLGDGTIAITYDANEHLTRHAAGVGWGAGESALSPGSLTEEVDEEEALERFIEEVANLERNNRGATTPTKEVQAGKQLGERHLRKLLKAVGRGCLEGTSSVEEKVNLLVVVVLPEAEIPSAETPNAPEGTFVRPPVPAPSHDGLIEQLAADLEALKAVTKSDDGLVQRLAAELEALQTLRESDKEEHHAEVEALRGKITMLERRVRESHGGLGGSVNAGGGYLFAQEHKTETREEFNESWENPVAARAADRQTVAPGEFRVVQSDLEECRRETGYLDARVLALEEGKRGNKTRGIRFPWRGNH